MTTGFRQVRAVALIGAALIVLAAASFVYLRPAPVAERPAATPGAVQAADGSARYTFVVTGTNEGGYFTWSRTTRTSHRG